MEADKQLAHLLQQLHNAGVPEDIGIDILKSLMVQIALKQVLNELDLVKQQHNEAWKDFYKTA